MKLTKRVKEIMAIAAREWIMQEVRNGRPYVFYSEVFAEIGVDRFTGAYILGKLQELDHDYGYHLWSSLVSYKEDQVDKETGKILYRAGEPGGDFYECARELGYNVRNRRAFLEEQRKGCRRFVDAGVRLSEQLKAASTVRDLMQSL